MLSYLIALIILWILVGLEIIRSEIRAGNENLIKLPDRAFSSVVRKAMIRGPFARKMLVALRRI